MKILLFSEAWCATFKTDSGETVRKKPWVKKKKEKKLEMLSPQNHSQWEYKKLIQNTDESQAGIKTAKRNINNLTYADDITLIAESEEELKRLLTRVKEESEKAGLKLNIQKT